MSTHPNHFCIMQGIGHVARISLGLHSCQMPRSANLQAQFRNPQQANVWRVQIHTPRAILLYLKHAVYVEEVQFCNHTYPEDGGMGLLDF